MQLNLISGTLDIQGIRRLCDLKEPRSSWTRGKLNVSSEEALVTSTPGFGFDTYTVNLTLRVNTETSQAIWHYYPNDETPEGSELIAPMYAEAVEYFDLSSYASTYLGNTLFVKEYDYAAAKAAAKGELAIALGTYNEADYSAENWVVLNKAKTDGDAAIEQLRILPEYKQQKKPH